MSHMSLLFSARSFLCVTLLCKRQRTSSNGLITLQWRKKVFEAHSNLPPQWRSVYKLYCAIHRLGIYPIRKRYPPFEQPKPALLTSLLIKQKTSEYRQTTELYSNSTPQISVDYGDALHTLKRRVVRCAYTIFLRARSKKVRNSCVKRTSCCSV